MERSEQLLEDFSTHDAALARIAELEAALRKIADMKTEGEPVNYSWGLEYFNRAHKTAVDALRHRAE